jgi:hypothetical protein
MRTKTRVSAFRNLDQGKKWTVQNVKGNKIFRMMSRVILLDVVFRVNELGRQRMIQERKQNIHAWVEGVMDLSAEDGEWVPILYQPYLSGHFVLKEDQTPLFSAKKVLLTEHGAWVVLNPETRNA